MSARLTDWDRHHLRIALLEVCDIESGITVQDLLRHERILPYSTADITTVRTLTAALVDCNLLFQRGKTSGKVFRTLPLGRALIALYREHPPREPVRTTVDKPRPPRPLVRF